MIHSRTDPRLGGSSDLVSPPWPRHAGAFGGDAGSLIACISGKQTNGLDRKSCHVWMAGTHEQC